MANAFLQNLKTTFVDPFKKALPAIGSGPLLGNIKPAPMTMNTNTPVTPKPASTSQYNSQNMPLPTPQVGPMTAPISAPTKPAPMVNTGDANVRAQQIALNANGAGLKVDGILGPLTMAAIKNKEAAVNKTPSGGVINPATGGVSESPVPPPTYADPATPPVPTVADTYRKDVTTAEEAYKTAGQMTAEEEVAQKELGNLTSSFKTAYQNTEDQAIPMAFITGQQSSLEKRALNLAEPLETKLARLQAKRMSALETSKFALDRADARLKSETDRTAPKSMTLGAGESVGQYDPITGTFKNTYTAPATPKALPESQDPNRVLTATEAQSLGVPFGTTAGQAYGLSPTKPLTEAQGKDLTYANRATEANPTLDSMANTIASYNPAKWMAYIAAENTTIGNTLVPAEIKQIRQAERNFATAVLRRESGATISPTEFAVMEKQYFPRPGDDAKTLAQKAQLRNTAIESFKTSAGSAAFPTNASTGNTGGGVVQTKIGPINTNW